MRSLYKIDKKGGGNNEVEMKIPVITFTYKELNFHGNMIIVPDVGGCDIRPPGRDFSTMMVKKSGPFDTVDVVIFMVGSNNKYQLDADRDQLQFTIDQGELNGSVPLLVLCNKQDFPDAISRLQD